MGSYDIEREDRLMAREPIAVVGSSCRLPGGATSPSKLWDLLENPRDVLQEIPSTRFNTSAFYHENSQHHGSMNVRHAYLLDEDPRCFDRDFFSINPKEAEAIDPQQRQLLECVYEGVESTGYTIQQLRGSSTAVFVGCMSYDYFFTAIRGIDSLPQYHATGTAASILANRVSYFYDWKGPSITIDTACSSSLVAVHQAVSALRNGEAKMAVAAGSNLILGPEPFVSESKLNMLSPNGRSYMWDASADGYTRGEGFATVFLKTLSQALADGDHIECIIRETGVNSDGKTPGITMPSSESQARLIRDTYARCGLDPELESDRPQYFEAHGTGTQAGDPIEARAIHDVFFAGRNNTELLVGSVKTVIGHTEGTAGVAGVLKASLAVQNGSIPRNLHFNKLNNKIEPYYNNLRIPTDTTAWPTLPAGCPRRVSVNSFGFGGTNAHAIIESYDASSIGMNGHTTNGELSHNFEPKTNIAGPFVLSAHSATALSASAEELASHLREHPDTDLAQLAYTLFRRADFPFRAAFSATDVEGLASRIEASGQSLKSTSRVASASQTSKLPVHILGIFTGQGAQWPSMGKDLLHASAPFRAAIDRMQRSLDALPDRPDWTLVDQIMADPATSRVSEATVSQPLCTALQIGLVDVLQAAGVRLSAVVGHSSGEIGAAYAAGYLTDVDAIRIAYYRGVHSHLAQGPDGKRGKMMAVGMSLEQATAFCSEFDGALVVAASNSLTSCTLAGNAEAIDDANTRFQQDGIFARVLQVDTAYHSHHMKACGGPYLDSMQNCGVKVRQGRKDCRWYSSVFGSKGRTRSFDHGDSKLLEGQYWVDNMAGTVLFKEALSRAIKEHQVFDFALEVGPHPALKGPSSETIKALTGVTLPYSGVLKRGQNAVESFADALGFIWKSFPSPRPLVTFDNVRRAFPPKGKSFPMSIIKGLPSYSWDRNGLIWKESRASRAFRTQTRSRHELLGHAVTHGERDKREVHWKQLLRLGELPWLAGHRIQGEVLFPASGYLAMAYEAAIRLIDNQPLRLVELHDVDIVRAMRLEEDSSGLEVAFTIRVTGQNENIIDAEVACYSGPVDTAQPLDAPLATLTAHFTAKVRLSLGDSGMDTLPLRTKPSLPMDSLDMPRLYASLSKKGFNYAELFQAKSMLRRLNRAVVDVPEPPATPATRLCMHPAIIDTAFHGLLAAFSFPEDGRLGSIYLPTRVDCVRISMLPSEYGIPSLKADAILTSTGKSTLTGDLDLFDSTNARTEVQIRGVHLTAVGQRKDPWLYSGVTWARDVNDGIEPGTGAKLSEAEVVKYEQLTRTAHFFLRQLRKKIRPQEMLLMGKYRKHMMTWVNEHLLPQIDAGHHPELRPECKDDTLEMVETWRSGYPADDNDWNILMSMGKALVNIVRGILPPLRVLTQDNMLDRLYVEGIGVQHGNVDLGAAVTQLAHQYPKMRVLEVGAGTGGTTRTVLEALRNQFVSYTYTDISTGFFDNARTVFNQYISKLVFKTLNIENDPVEQGFAAETYDLVVSSNCLHATKSLAETLQHCRRLLKPGGRLLLLEVTQDFLSTQLIMSTLSGWFLGIEDGRVWAPTVSVGRWNELLRENGFSGVDFSSSPSYCSVIMAQAVDQRIQNLREPLSVAPEALLSLKDILIVGNGVSSTLATRAQEILRAAVPTATTVTLVPGLECIQVPTGAAILCLCDLDSPVFRDMNEARFKGLQDVMSEAATVLWTTTGAKSGNSPEANLTVGLSSTLLGERTNLSLQFLDIDDPSSADASRLAIMLLRMAILNSTEADELVWNLEPELALRKGALYMPRIRAIDTVNRRSAARMRTVTQMSSLKSRNTAVSFDERDGALKVQAVSPRNAGADEILLQVGASSLNSITCDHDVPLYLCSGLDLDTGDKILALADVCSSIVRVSAAHTLKRWKQNEHGNDDTAIVAQFITRALAEHLLEGLTGPVWIHGAPEILKQAIDEIAREQETILHQSTSASSSLSDIRFIHPFETPDVLSSLWPTDLKNFVNLSPMEHMTLSASIRSSLPKSSVARDILDLTDGLRFEKIQGLAQRFFDSPLEDLKDRAEVFAIDNLSAALGKRSIPVSVINWTTSDTVSALVPPLEHDGLFSKDKTYLLCGMTGDLGISVCLWMVEHGARYVVLTSRKPNVPADILDYFSRKGAIVRPMAVDITSMDSLRGAYKDIQMSMPPIAGVMNAAMVLRDRLFHTLSLEDFSAVLGPKVTGSKNLDELFGDQQLEFFICFSSTTSIIGSIGQSAYAAANHYMASLVHGRQQRGLAGSVIYIAILTGFGYIFRRDSDHADTIYRSLLPRCEMQSETDLHEMLAEAIVCGRPGPGQIAELVTGIKPVFQDERREDPRLSSYVGQQQEEEESLQSNTQIAVSVKVQLAAAEDPADCLGILIDCFAQSLGNLLELDPEQLDSNMAVASLGIDSLVAIRIREWFLRETGVDVPVLKIMSDTYSLSRLCEDVLVDWRRTSKV